jgi:hypothetical protein
MNDNQSNFGTDQGTTASVETLLSQMTPIGSSELADISGGDHIVENQRNRGVTCTSGTTIKVDYLDIDGETINTIVLPAERRMIGCRCITKVYATGTDALNIYVIR